MATIGTDNMLGRQGKSPRPMEPAHPLSVIGKRVYASHPIALQLCLGLVFLRFSMIHLLLALKTGINLYLLYVFGIPALVALIVVGGFLRSFQGRPAWYWTAFGAWIAISAPLSTWRGGSVEVLLLYLRTSWLMLFIIAGIVITWKDCEKVMTTIAWATVVNLLSATFFENSGDRLGLDFGAVGNSNDFAAHLLLVLPFLLWKALRSKSQFMRVLAFLGVPYGIFIIFNTASRGALIGLAAGIVFILLKGTVKQRLGVVIVVPVALGVIMLTVPDKLLNRIGSFSSNAKASVEAIESTQAREYVLNKSLDYTFQFPIFGVGPGQFPVYEGVHNQTIGTHGLYHQTHNTWTQVSSECGIPGLIFFVGGIVSTILLLNKTYQKAKKLPGCEDIKTATFCMLLGLLCFTTAVSFLSFAYFFYFPAISGLAIAVHRAAEQEMQSGERQPVLPPARDLGFVPSVFAARARPVV